MRIVPLLSVLFLFSFAPNASPCALPSGSADAVGQLVRDKLAAGHYWEARALCEEDVARAPLDVEAWLRMGEVFLDLGTDPDRTAGDPATLLSEASRAFAKVLDLDPNRDGVLPLAYDTHMAAGAFASAVAVASRGVGATMLTDGAPSGYWLERVARAERHRFHIIAPEAPAAYAAALCDTEARLKNARAARREHGPTHIEHAKLLFDVGLPRRATETLHQALSDVPTSVDLHREFIDAHVCAGLVERLPSIYSELTARFQNEGLVWWYRAWVGVILGEQLRREVRWGQAETLFAESIEWAATAAARSPEHADGARRLVHRARLGRAYCALAERDHGLALDRFTDLLGSDQELRNEPDGLGRSVIHGIGILGWRYVEARDFAAGAELMRLVLLALPDEHYWWNNLAYMLREHGPSVMATGGQDAAREVFRDSWEAYQRAIALDPENARYTNDAALIQVYHLREELALAEEMLLRAVSLGESQIAALGELAEETSRYPIALAVGDALENLGYLFYHVVPDPARSEGFYERSLASNSGARWNVVEYLSALRGEREPIEDFAFSPRPPANRSPTPHIAWEPSFDGALVRAASEGRPVFLYYRGDGLAGLDGEFWYRVLGRDGFSDRVGAAISVVGDPVRHTPADRRGDGTRVACPRYGSNPCGAHVRSGAEFASFFAEKNSGASPGAGEEGFHLVSAEGEAIEWAPAILDEMGVEGTPITAAITVDLPTPKAGADPRQLRADIRKAASIGDRVALNRFAVLQTAAMRDAMEVVALDRGVPRRERAEILAALAESADAVSRELLEVCLRQSADAELQGLAAGAWQDDQHLELLWRASQWGTPAVRRQAAQRLRDLISMSEDLRRMEVIGVPTRVPGQTVLKE